jgi:transposase-like protein
MKKTPSCPRDHTSMRVETRPIVVAGVDLGRFEVWVCPVCHRVFDPPATSLAIDRAAKAKGIFGAELEEMARPSLPSRSTRAHA